MTPNAKSVHPCHMTTTQNLKRDLLADRLALIEQIDAKHLDVLLKGGDCSAIITASTPVDVWYDNASTTIFGHRKAGWVRALGGRYIPLTPYLDNDSPDAKFAFHVWAGSQAVEGIVDIDRIRPHVDGTERP